MAWLSVNGQCYDIDLVVFDKDGTLIDFHHLWVSRARGCLQELVRQVQGGEALAYALQRSLGYDPQTDRALVDGPLACASMSKLYTVVSVVLYQHGLDWHRAEKLTEQVLTANLSVVPTPDLVQPLGDVAGLFRRLTAAGVRIALATSDDRTPTQITLPLLDIETEVSLAVCGDDPIPNKPAPDALWHLAENLGVEPGRMMMVGDTVGDLMTGTSAGVVCRVGVLSGAGDRASLIPHADVILDSIHGIQIV